MHSDHLNVESVANCNASVKRMACKKNFLATPHSQPPTTPNNNKKKAITIGKICRAHSWSMHLAQFESMSMPNGLKRIRFCPMRSRHLLAKRRN